MKGKIILNSDNCEIFFNYGIFSISNSSYIKSVIHFFELKNLPIFPKTTHLVHFKNVYNSFGKADQLIEKYYETNIATNQQKDERIYEKYKNILKSFNICLKNDLVEILSDTNTNDEYLMKLAKELEEADCVDVKLFYKKSKMIIFLLTKSYHESNLFKEDWKEAINSNKEIVIIINKYEDNLINESELKDHKILYFETEIVVHFDNSSLIFSNDTKLFKRFIQSLQKKVINLLSFLNLTKNNFFILSVCN